MCVLHLSLLYCMWHCMMYHVLTRPDFISDLDATMEDLKKQQGLLEPRLDFTQQMKNMAEVIWGHRGVGKLCHFRLDLMTTIIYVNLEIGHVSGGHYNFWILSMIAQRFHWSSQLFHLSFNQSWTENQQVLQCLPIIWSSYCNSLDGYLYISCKGSISESILWSWLFEMVMLG